MVSSAVEATEVASLPRSDTASTVRLSSAGCTLISFGGMSRTRSECTSVSCSVAPAMKCIGDISCSGRMYGRKLGFLTGLMAAGRSSTRASRLTRLSLQMIPPMALAPVCLALLKMSPRGNKPKEAILKLVLLTICDNPLHLDISQTPFQRLVHTVAAGPPRHLVTRIHIGQPLCIDQMLLYT